MEDIIKRTIVLCWEGPSAELYALLDMARPFASGSLYLTSAPLYPDAEIVQPEPAKSEKIRGRSAPKHHFPEGSGLQVLMNVMMDGRTRTRDELGDVFAEKGAEGSSAGSRAREATNLGWLREVGHLCFVITPEAQREQPWRRTNYTRTRHAQKADT